MNIDNDGRLSIHNIVTLTAICIMAPLSMTLIVPALPEMSERLNVSTSEIQYMISAFLIGLGVAQPIQGILADRFGRRRVLLANFVIFTLACVLTMLSSNWQLIILLRAVQGASVSAGSICSRAMITDLQAKEAAAVTFSYLMLGATLGPLIAPLLGAFLGGFFGWRSVYAFLGGAGFLVVGIVWLKINETLKPEYATRKIRIKPIIKNYSVLLGSSVFVGYTLMNTFCQAIFFVFLPIGAEFFKQQLKHPDSWFIAYWLFITVAFIIGTGFAAFSVKRYGNSATLRFACRSVLVIGIAMLSIWFLPNATLWSPLILLVPAMFFTGLISPLAINGAVANFPGTSGAAAGLSGSLSMIGGGIFSWLSGVLYNDSLRPMTALAGASALGIFLMLLLIRDLSAKKA